MVGLPIREVTRLLGVPAPTVRSWERRFGVASPARSSGGHRRYADDALVELCLMRDEIARGRRAHEAAEAVRAARVEGRGSPYVARLLAASHRLDAGGVLTALDDADRELGLGATIDEVLLPGMRRIGWRWEAGRCDVAQEHVTTEAARTWLQRRAAKPSTGAGEPILLACGPRDLHTLGLEALGVLLAERGRDCRLLGARTPARSLVAAIADTAAVAAVVVSHLSTARREAVAALRLADQTAGAVFFAGGAFLTAASRQRVPGVYLGESVMAAAAVVDAATTTAGRATARVGRPG